MNVMNPMTDTERILEIIRVKNLNNIQFCSITGISPASLSHITSNRSKPTLTILRNVISGFPDINPEWIMMGTGSMFRHGDGEVPAEENEGGMENATKQPETMPSLFPTDETHAAARRVQPRAKDEIRNAGPSTANVEDVVKTTLAMMHLPQRKIVEVRSFFDDGTYESFVGRAKS